MTNRLFISLLLIFQSLQAISQIHVATTGNDGNKGTADSPYLTIQHAVNVAQPGDTITVHAGRYMLTKTIRIPEKNTSDSQRCYLWADGEVIIDGSSIKYSNESEFKGGRCIYVSHLVNYWHFKGLTLCNAID
ncbi:MAG: DUF1565 domain-containing protein, partial [Prevotella sp.]|nr:DUF1565 domain-containing protein [Prevotella sp.]